MLCVSVLDDGSAEEKPVIEVKPIADDVLSIPRPPGNRPSIPGVPLGGDRPLGLDVPPGGDGPLDGEALPGAERPPGAEDSDLETYHSYVRGSGCGVRLVQQDDYQGFVCVICQYVRFSHQILVEKIRSSQVVNF